MDDDSDGAVDPLDPAWSECLRGRYATLFRLEAVGLVTGLARLPDSPMCRPQRDDIACLGGIGHRLGIRNVPIEEVPPRFLAAVSW